MRSAGSVTKENIIYREKGYARFVRCVEDKIIKVNYDCVAAVTLKVPQICFVLSKRRQMKSNYSIDIRGWRSKNGKRRVRDYFAFGVFWLT